MVDYIHHDEFSLSKGSLFELRQMGNKTAIETPIAIAWQGIRLAAGFRANLAVDNKE